MSISEENRYQVIRLIDEAEGLDLVDSDSFDDWMQASYKALEFDPLQQQRFDQYCRSSCESVYIRLFIGVWMLLQSLNKHDGRNGCAETASPI